MTILLISILSSTSLFVIFRLFPKFRIDTAQAIVFNYFTAFICGCFVEKAYPDFQGLVTHNLHWWTLLSGFLFISIFIGMGISSVKNGIGTTSVTVKMSMALTLVFFVIFYHEAVTFWRIIGFSIALLAVWLITRQPKQQLKEPGTSSILLLAYLFAGSSLLDIVLNYIEKHLQGYSPAIFAAVGFLTAGCLGALWMSIELLRKKRIFNWRNIPAGIVLGIPNYFSIYYLVRSYSSTGWSQSTTLAVTAISIVALSALIGIFIFKESAKPIRIAGLLAAVLAIVLLTAVK